MIRNFFVILAAALLTAVSATAQEVALPPPTQSQSGYPDIRQEAADHTLFPGADTRGGAASHSTRPGSGDNGGGRRNIRGRRVGSRSNDLLLGSADSDPLPVRISYRRAKTLAMERDPRLRSLLIQADLAGTDIEKREFLHSYYRELFTDVRKIDSSAAMNSHVAVLSRYVEQRYDPKRHAVAGEEDLINGGTSDHRIRTR